jgi:hypothetical protein
MVMPTERMNRHRITHLTATGVDTTDYPGEGRGPAASTAGQPMAT